MGHLTWLLVCALAIGLASSEKCTSTGDIRAKQQKLTEIIQYINRPYNIQTPKPQPTPEEEEYFRQNVGYLDEHEVFSVFDERYWKEANASLHYLLSANTYQDFVRAAEILRYYVNDDLFHYVFLVAVTHRDDTRGVNLPRVHEVWPDKFWHRDVISELKLAAIHSQKDIYVNDTEIRHDYRDPYSAVSYYLEDLGLNSHHYHWHVQNSLLWDNEDWPSVSKVHKDRLGEAFYYMHNQMVNRFDAELLSNHLPRVSPFENWDEPIEEGYASQLSIDSIQYHYTYRPPRIVLQDLPEMTRNQLSQWRSQILQAIHHGKVVRDDGETIYLTRNQPGTDQGIDVLGHLVESTVQSANRPLYGNIHSYAHVIAARVADPDSRYEAANGVMYDVTTSARDPLFYRWHKYVDDILQEYKNSLEPYSHEDLSWNDVAVEQISVEGSRVNKIKTYWEDESVQLQNGHTFTINTTPKIRTRHLAHEDFSYNLQVTNNAGGETKAIIRIYLSPKYDEQGEPLDFNDQRQSVIQLDKWVQTLTPGKNIITRKSVESSVTQKHSDIYSHYTSQENDDHCNCGWPSNLLIPRGSWEGTQFTVFAVVSSWEEDHVQGEGCQCGDGTSYCNVLLGKYWDRRPFGYPFDRHSDARTYEDFRTPNQNSVDISIQFVGNVKKSS